MSEFKETVGELFNLQGNKFFRTIRGLTIAPGDTIRAFAAGDRKSFLHPFTYAITIIGISLFLNSFVNIEFDFQKKRYAENEQEIELLTNKDELSKREKGHLEIDNKSKDFADFQKTEKFQRVSYYLMFFMVSLIQLLVFKNLKFGLKKNTWYNFYVFGNSILITLPLNLFYIFFVGDDYLTIVFLITGIISFLLGLIYQIWAASQYYEISILRALKKYFFIYIFVVIFYLLLVIISTIVMISYLYLSLS